MEEVWRLCIKAKTQTQNEGVKKSLYLEREALISSYSELTWGVNYCKLFLFFFDDLIALISFRVFVGLLNAVYLISETIIYRRLRNPTGYGNRESPQGSFTAWIAPFPSLSLTFFYFCIWGLYVVVFID